MGGLPITELIGKGLALPKYRFPDVGPSLAAMLERLRESLPPNWPTKVDIDEVSASSKKTEYRWSGYLGRML